MDNYILLIISCLIFFYCGELRAEQCLSFPLGVFLSKYKYRVYRYINKYTIICCLLIGFLALFIKQFDWCRAHNILFVFVQILNKLPLALSIMFMFLGKYSYELYLTHILFIPMLIVNTSLSIIPIYIILFILSALFIYKIKVYVISLLKK